MGIGDMHMEIYGNAASCLHDIQVKCLKRARGNICVAWGVHELEYYLITTITKTAGLGRQWEVVNYLAMCVCVECKRRPLTQHSGPDELLIHLPFHPFNWGLSHDY